MNNILFLSHLPVPTRYQFRWRSALAAFLGYLLFAVLLTYPSIIHLSDRIIGDGGDNYQFLAFQYLGNQQFLDGQLPFGWTNTWRYPVGFDFGSSYDSTLLIIIGVVLYPLFSSPALVYNLSVLLLVALSCTLSFIFFSSMVRQSWLGFVMGCIFGGSFYVIARLGGHPNLLLIGCFPFFLYSLFQLRAREVDRQSCLVFMTASILVFLASLQYLLVLVGSLLFVIPITYAYYPEYIRGWYRLLLNHWQKLLLPIAGILAVFLFFHSGKVFSLSQDKLILPTPDIVTVPPINYILPDVYLRTWVSTLGINDSRDWIEHVLFLGYVEMAIGVVFFFLPSVSARFKWYLATIISIFFLVSLGGHLTEDNMLPYPFLFQVFPFRGIVEPGRFAIVIFLVLTLMIGQVLQRIPRKSTWVSLIVLALVVIERFPVNFYLSPTLEHQPFIAAVSKTQTDAVLDLPIFQEWWNGQYYDMYAIYYHKPIVNGYIHWLGNTPSSLAMVQRLQRFTCSTDPAFIPKTFTDDDVSKEKADNRQIGEMLKRYKITTIVYHKDYSVGAKGCEDAVYRMPLFLEQSDIPIQKVYSDDNKEVYVLE